MTLQKFNRLLKKISPKLNLRYRGFADQGGLFVGHSGKTGYIARITKGELHQDGYRESRVDPSDGMKLVQGPIIKRGRKTLINILRNYRWVKTHQQRTMLQFGIEK